ncbi:MAG TPA: LuxR family transcriptional regulator [Allosphingosinicella sp.]|jgi:LuxR family quorum-sensing system transcriptional regulator CciR
MSSPDVFELNDLSKSFRFDGIAAAGAGPARQFNLQRLEAQLAAARTWPELDRVLLALTQQLGLDFYALNWRTGRASPSSPQPLMKVRHNYPERWVQMWKEWTRRGRQDPVVVASQQTSIPFTWFELHKREGVDTDAAEFMEAARAEGLADGITVPLHTADGGAGACHFSVGPGRALPKNDHLIIAGLLVCNAAHRLSALPAAAIARRKAPRLTPRQMECTVLAARGLTEGAIGKALNISDETVKRHLKQARQTYSVSKTIQLITRCLHDESITFDAVVNERLQS